jgi:hypothetical protein
MIKPLIASTILSIVAGTIAGFVSSTYVRTSGGNSLATIRAKRIEIVDASEKVRILMAENDRGNVSMTFLDPDGKTRLQVAMTPDGRSQSIVFRDTQGRSRITLGSDSDGKPALNMGDERSESRMLLGFVPNDVPSTTAEAWGLEFRRPGIRYPSLSLGIGQTVNGSATAAIRIQSPNGKVWFEPK